MARLFGLIGNRADLSARVLAFEREALMVRAEKATPPSLRSGNGGSPRPAALGWGLGFYQGGEVLMRRRPIDEHEIIDVAKIAADVRGDVVLGHVRAATVGTLRTENTHPFRYRQFLFAQTGTLPAFDQIRERLHGSIPEFLRAGIRGETDAEVTFNIFLSFLHDRGRLADGVTVDVSAVREALRSTLALIDGMAAEVGAEPAALNLGVTDGENLVFSHRGAPMGTRVFSGKGDAEMILGDDRELRRRTPELAQMHFVLVASDFDDDSALVRSSPAAPEPRWKAVPEYAMVSVSRGKDPVIEPLS
jgi:glutamine amidotransferase